MLRSAIVSFLVAGFSSLAASLRGVSELGAALWHPIRPTSSSRTCDVFQEALLCSRLVKRGRSLLPAIGIDGGPVSFPFERPTHGHRSTAAAEHVFNGLSWVRHVATSRKGAVTDRIVRGGRSTER